MNKQNLLEKLKKDNVPEKILEAFAKVRREDFVPSNIPQAMIYEDIALSIGYNQTISQPFTIAVMLNLLDLKKGQKVLEVGSGCGYVLALISEMTKSEVYGIEVVKELAEKSRENLKNYDVEIYNKNGAEGLKEEDLYATSIEVQKRSRPSVFEERAREKSRGSLVFERILISASCKEVPKTLLNQLTDNGVLVAPVENSDDECSLVKIFKENNQFIEKERIPHFSFVKFVEK